MVRRPALVLGTLWVAGAVFATSVGLVAVRLVGNEVGDPVATPLSGEAVRQALVSVPPSPPGAEGQEPAEPGELGAVRTVSTRGGVLSARCRDHLPVLLYATPADGYRTVRSNGDVVRFEGNKAQVAVTLSCSDEELVARTVVSQVGGAGAPSPSPAPSFSPEPSPSPEPQDSSPGQGSPEPAGDSSSPDGTETGH